MFGIILILGVLLISSVALPNLETSKRNRKRFCILVFGSMYLFAMLRGGSVGIDNANRYPVFEQICGMDIGSALRFMFDRSDGEYGNAFVSVILSRFLPTPHLITMVFDLFIVYSFGYFFYLYAEDLPVTSLMYFAFSFSASLNITRQYFAMAIILWAIIAIIKNKRALSLILLLIAVSFHISAVFMFLLYLLYLVKFKLTKKLFLFVAIAGFAFFLLFDQVSTFIVDRYLPQYSWYLRGTWAVGEQKFSYLWLIIYSIMLVLLYFNIGKPSLSKFRFSVGEEQLKVPCIVNMAFIVFTIISMLNSKVWFLSRMKTYCSFGYYMAMGMIMNRLRFLSPQSRRIVRFIFIIGMSVWAIQMYQADTNGLFPYVFFWE